MPLEELPGNIQELFQYNPAKAKQLLAEAGYPNGFKAELILEAGNVDYASIAQFYLAKIGINLQLSVKESGVFTSISIARSHPEAIWTGMAAPYSQHEWRVGHQSNVAYVDDPRMTNMIAEFAKYFMIDDEKAYAEFGKIFAYSIEQAYYLPLPAGRVYTAWWPWLKGYSGESMFGATSQFGFIKWIWLDQALKKSMGF
ncbi:MAG: hypothetical protein HYU83_02695 [Chloroflexi bacterium]|nr:hypothetical protein [Chloroflexota bacterium]